MTYMVLDDLEHSAYIMTSSGKIDLIGSSGICSVLYYLTIIGCISSAVSCIHYDVKRKTDCDWF